LLSGTITGQPSALNMRIEFRLMWTGLATSRLLRFTGALRLASSNRDWLSVEFLSKDYME
jgi:hypothetical protein